jgi:hypothetical protein
MDEERIIFSNRGLRQTRQDFEVAIYLQIRFQLSKRVKALHSTFGFRRLASSNYAYPAL